MDPPDSSLSILDGNMEQYVASLLHTSTLHRGWSVEALLDPSTHESIIQAHCDFIKSGANIVSTFNSAVLPFFLKFKGLEQQFVNLHQLSAKLAHRAVQLTDKQKEVKVAGILPAPSRSFQEWTIMMDTDFQHIYGDITKALATNVDLLIAQDLKQTREALQIAKIVKQKAPHIPLYLSFNLRSSTEIRNGDNLQQVINTLQYLLEKPANGYGMSGTANDVIQAATQVETQRSLLLYIASEEGFSIPKEELPKNTKIVGVFPNSTPLLVEKLKTKF